MGERRGTKALELWCRRITEGYPDVNVQNMTTSWRDGLAFCAMIHHFRPDLIDFDNLDKNDVYGNNELAFRVAEQHLGIPALLDAEDMASCSVPDRLSILTYLSQFYQTLGGSSPARHPVSRTTETVEERITELPESPKEKEASCLGMRKDSCVVCGFPIFLAEKLVLSHVAYHRTCFRCARCSNQLTIGNYYETEEGQYCCERCPDEEIPLPSLQSPDDSTYSGISSSEIDSNYTRLLKTEESINKQLFARDPIQKLDREDCIVPDIIAQTSRLRLNFISNQMLSEDDEQVTGNTSESRNDVIRGRVHLTTDVSLTSPNHEFGKQNKKDLPATSSKQESHDRRGAIETASEKFPNTKGYIHHRLNSDRYKLKEVSPSSSRDTNGEKLSYRKNDKELSKQVDERGYVTSTSSIVQERRKIFERKEDQVDKSEGKCRDAEVPIYKAHGKHEVSGNIESSVMIPDTTQTVSQENVSVDDVKSVSANSSVQTISSDLSEATDERVVAANLSVSASDTKDNEDQASATVVNDNAVNTVAANSVENYPEDLNPFKCDDEEEIVDKSTSTTNTAESSGDLTNPFENDEKAEDEVVKEKETIPPKPATRNSNKSNQQFLLERPTKRRLIAPQINLNPFWSDEDDHDSDLEPRERTSEVTPTPKPRTIKHIEKMDINGQKLPQNHDSLRIQNNCIRSPESGSIGGAYRKKKPAPLPPNKKEPCHTNQHTPSISKQQCSSPEHRDASTHTIPRARKAKPAPPVPTTSNFEECSMNDSYDTSKERNIWEDQKINKDEKNRNKQSFTHMSYGENFHCKPYVDKSIEGKWKRKKGPAPLCPMPCRRKIKVMSLKDVKLELDEIELQQQGLEKQGVRLEQLIRSKCESGSRTNDVSLGTDVEELVLELFALVNEKNELFRRQAELMLLRRQQRLEEEHAEVEFQIRCLMTQHESTKTDFDKQREEALIQRLVEIVEKRNEIVDCLEMDRRREIEEDRSIHHHMDLFAVARNKNESSSNDINISEKKKRKQNKQKEKVKDRKLKKTLKKDIDKDVDEIELTLKRHNKRKWF